MEPYGAIKAEAQRWLGIAVKLLSGRDLVGSKTFAIRARESDPRLDFADQIIAVADTLIAADKRINNQHDWYAILQIIGRTHDSDLIATQYRQLTLLLNPDQNNLPLADLAFKLVCDAWVILSNPSTKSVYDSEINFLSVVNSNPVGSSRQHEQHQQQNLNRHHEHQQWQQQQQPTPLQQLAPQQQIQPPLVRPVPHQPVPSRPVAKQPVQSRPVPRKQQKQSRRRVQEPGVRQNPRKVTDNTAEEVNNGLDNSDSGNVDESDTIWTACPYCFNMYEYPRVYVDCTLRCQNCKRAFQAISIPMRPPVVEGKEAYFSCWGFFPLVIREPNLKKKNDKSLAKWNPFSPMFTFPPTVENATAGGSDYVNATSPTTNSPRTRKSPAPRVYVDIDDEDAYLNDSEGDDDTDDDDWGTSTMRRKRTKSAIEKSSSVGRPRKRSQIDKAKNVKGSDGSENLQGAIVTKDSLQAPKMATAETSKKAVAITTRRQSARGAKELGKLDLNVECSNEVEEHAPAASEGNQNGGAGHREEDNIEGIGFFEGLDEFLNNLPILVVDDKVKAA